MAEKTQTPTIIHLGKKSKKEIKKYKLGIGSMFMEVQSVLARAKATVAPGSEVLPMVVLHHKKRKGILSRTTGLFKS